MKTKVCKAWYDQEIRAFDWQIKEEPRLIALTEKRIENLKNGGVDSVGCDMNYLVDLLAKCNSEKGIAQKRKDVFIHEHEVDENIKPDKKGAELFIRTFAYKTRTAKSGEQFGYYDFLSTVAKLFGLRDRDDSVIDWYFGILDDELLKLNQ